MSMVIPKRSERKYEPYPEYKDSSIEWLGEIPACWDTKKLKHLLFRNDGGVWGDDYDENGTIVLRSTEQTVGGEWHINEPAIRHINAEEYKKSKLICEDLLITKSSGSELHIGKTTLVTREIEDMNCCFSNFMQRIRLLRNYSAKYIYYVFNCILGREQLVYYSNTTTGLANLSSTIIGNIHVAIPDYSEQQTIADFLDRETTRIDELIARKQRLIELMQEKRTALITHTVTKGLNSDDPMKESGVEWLGGIPAHWEVKKLKRITSIPITDGPHETPEFIDDGVPFVSAESVWDGRVHLESMRGFISREQHQVYKKKYQPEKYDVYIVKSGATTGKIAIVDFADEFNIWSPLAVVRCNFNKAIPWFIYYALSSDYFQRHIQLSWSYGTQPNIGMNVLSNLAILLPPISEQQAIADYLDKETSRIDDLVGRIIQAIEKLQEYRSALITAAVAGKIDVREHVS